MNENLLKVNFPRKINNEIKDRYENLLCHKIFVEERLETLDSFHQETDKLKYTINKGFPVVGELRENINKFLDNPNKENWNLIKNSKISGKKTSEEVWNDYIESINNKQEITGSLFLFAIKHSFDKEIKGYKSRLNNTKMQIDSIKKIYPNIDNEINLENL